MWTDLPWCHRLVAPHCSAPSIAPCGPWRGLGIAAVGGVVGILMSMVAARYLEALLYEVTVYDPVTIGGIAAVVGIASAFARLPPALRATRTDPMVVMRTE